MKIVFFLWICLLSGTVSADQDHARGRTPRRLREGEVAGAKHSSQGNEMDEGASFNDKSYWERFLAADVDGMSIPTASPTKKPDPLQPEPTETPVAETPSPTKSPPVIDPTSPPSTEGPKSTKSPTKTPAVIDPTSPPTAEVPSSTKTPTTSPTPGGDEPEVPSSTKSPTTSPTPEVDGPSDPPSEAELSVAGIVQSNPKLSTLESLVDSVDLLDVLDDPTLIITLFAPNNGAFMNADASLVADLIKAEYGLHLMDLLMNHLTLGDELFAADLIDGLVINTASTFDEFLEVNLNGTDVLLETAAANEAGFEEFDILPAKVVDADMDATNGVVHEIDQLLLTRWVYQDFVDAAATEPSFSTFLDYVVLTGLDGVSDASLREATDSTLLIPTNAAFDALPQETKDFLEDPDNVETLREILKYHLIPQVFNYQLYDDETVALPGGITASVGPIVLGVTPLPTFNDITTSFYALSRSGVIYAVDEVLIPPTEPEPSPSPMETPTKAPSEEAPTDFSVMDVVDTRSNLSVLQTAVNASGLRDALDSPANTITLFAPSNNAFMDIEPSFLVDLLTPEYGLHLDDLLLYHTVLGEELFEADLTDELEVTTASTEGDTLLVDRTDGVKLITSAARDDELDNITIPPSTVVVPDIDATNGVVHQINKVLLSTWFYNDFFDTAERYPDKFREIAMLIVLAGLEDDIRGLEGATLLLPNNAAIKALDKDTLNFLTDPDNIGLLQGILTYHLIEEVFNYQLYEGQESTQLTASQGSVIEVTFTDDINVRLFNGVTSSAVYLSRSGLIYELDGVLTPPTSVPDAPTPAPVGGEPESTEAPTEVPTADEPGSTKAPTKAPSADEPESTEAPTTKSQKQKSTKAPDGFDGV